MINFIDLKKQYDRMKSSIDSSISTVLDHGQYIMGPEVGQLEKDLVNFSGSKYCLSCSSGTDALLIVLMAYDIGLGDAVFTSTFSFISSAEVIKMLGATPVFVDVDPDTFNISCSDLVKKIDIVEKSSKLIPKCIIPVDIFGLPADYDKIETIAKKYNIKVLSDGAQSFGSSINGRKACTFSNATATSFYPSKPLGCYGDGGAIFTNDEELFKKIFSIRNHGFDKHRYKHVRVGVNGRLDTIQAAILLQKLKLFKEEINRRQYIYETYRKALESEYFIQMVPEGFISTWAQFSIISKKNSRDEIIKSLKSKGVPTTIHYPVPLHKQDVFKSKLILAESERISNSIFSIPMHAYLSKEDQQIIIKALLDIS